MKKLILFAAVTASLISCSEKASVATTVEPVEETAKAEMTLAATEGKTLFEAKCQKCHKLKNVDNYSQAEWSKILPNMAGKAKLEAEETAKIDNYIQWELKN